MNKNLIHLKLRELVQRNIEDCKNALDRIDESSQNETKSSAGDKYETGRAMLQQEYDKVNSQKERWELMILQLDQIKTFTIADKVVSGSLVVTTIGSFYISIPLGKIDSLESQKLYAISLDSPMSKSLIGHSVSDTVRLNGREFEILEIM